MVLKDYKQKRLYLGLDPPQALLSEELIHYPVIEIVPLSWAPFPPSLGTHLIFTSKTTVSLFLKNPSIQGNIVAIAVGRKTGQALKECGWHALCPFLETQEGIVELIKTLDVRGAHFLFPHSALSRPYITAYFKEQGIPYTERILYTTVVNRKLPHLDLSLYSEAIFTSPSTVEAFFTLYPQIPLTLKCRAIGPITQRALLRKMTYSRSSFN